MSISDKALGLIRDKKFRFLLVGGFNFVWGLASYPVLYTLLAGANLTYLEILIIAYLVNTALAYLTQKFFVFRTEGNFAREFGKFLSLQMVIFIVNLIVLPLAVDQLKLNPMIAQTAFALTLAVVSFVFHDKVTFTAKRHKAN